MDDKKTFQARASLVDRLIDDLPGRSRELRPLRTLNRKKLRESLLRDLLWLFNTRTPVSGKTFDNENLTVLEYGIPDFGAYFTASSDDQIQMTRRLVRAISIFEPRLRDVRVSINPVIRNEKTVQVMIDAMMVVEDVREPVSFRTIYQNDSRDWQDDTE